VSEHEEAQHSLLSPSSAERWISCPASVRLSETLPEPPESAYALEGTAAHALAEQTARAALLGGEPLFDAWSETYAEHITDLDELIGHVKAYVDLLAERLAAYPNSVLMLEQRLPTGVPQSWGTSDAVIVSPQHVEIVDLKYGMGVRVDPQDNPQLRLYAVGALEAYGSLLGEVTEVLMTVHQPRLEHTATATMTPDDLLAWRDSIIGVAETALGDDAPFGPSEAACRWCPARGQCKAQMEWATRQDFAVKADVMTPAEIADALDQLPAIEDWVKALKDHALDLAYAQGVDIPGYKVVMSGGRRSFTDEAGAIESLRKMGYEDVEVADVKIKGIGAIEKLLGKDAFAAQMEPYVSKSEGKPSVVPDTDSRPAVNPDVRAANEFKESE